nr:cell division control protein 48 [Cryptomonas sp.]
MKFSKIKSIDVKFFQFLIMGYFPRKISDFGIYNIIQANLSLFLITIKEFCTDVVQFRLLDSFWNFETYFIRRKLNEPQALYIYGSNLQLDVNMETKNVSVGKKQSLKLYKKYKVPKSRNNIPLRKPVVRYLDFAGINRILNRIQESIEWPFRYYKIYQKLKISPSRGILLYGYPGTGKTLLAHVIAGELDIPILYISPSSIISSISGESEKKIQNIFAYAEKKAPCIIFIDEIDGIGQSREFATKEMERRIIGQLLVSMDLIRMKKDNPIFVIAATNQIETIDKALRRPGRFDYEIKLDIPTLNERYLILTHFTKHILLSKNVNLSGVAKNTRGFVSGDLSALVKNVTVLALSRICTTIFKGKYRAKNISLSIDVVITRTDFEHGLTKTEPSLLRYGFLNKHEIFWDQIGALNSVRMILSKYIIEPIRNPLSISSIKNKGVGVLLYGPPGCGKTLIAQATACESGANYIGIKGPEIFDKFLGESEKTIRLIFERARLCSPTIIFFDEIDSIASKRSENGLFQQNGASDRIVNQLLTEMDGIDKKESIYVIGATNRPDNIDKAMLRPGRMDKLLFVPLPGRLERIRILQTISKKISALPYLNFGLLSRVVPNTFSGADLMSSTREAVIKNTDSKTKYVILENATDGLFIVLNNFISTRDYFSGIKNVKRAPILEKKNRKGHSQKKKNFLLK